jgi:hypothetical protein
MEPLGGHVGEGADDVAGQGVLAGGVECPGDTEIDHLGGTDRQ